MKKAEFINTVIKRRVFSWTKLFDQFERAFQDNVKMISVTPTFGEESIQINMQVAGKNLNDIVRLITVLENSPAFADVTFRSEQSGQDGLLNAGITLSYIPENASDQPVTAAATGETEPQSSVDSASEDEESYQEEETQ